MANRKVYISGEIVPEEDAKISIFDSAVLLGDTVTESTRTFNYKPYKLDEHIDRLYKSFKLTRIDPQMSKKEMLDVSLNLLEINKDEYGTNEDCWLVHNVSRGHSITGGNPALQVSKPTVMIYTQPMNLILWAPFYTKGCHAVIPSTRMVPSQSLDARIKNRSRLFYTLAEIEAKLVDPDAQSVILDIHGNVAENKGGNIFGICGGFQMLGNKLFDPLLLERSNQLKELSFEGLDLIAIDTFFENDKALFQRKVEAFWPENIEIKGFELHHGISKPIVGRENELQQISNDKSLGWLVKGSQIIGGTYLHGIFDNGIWRRSLINKLRCQKGIRPLKLGVEDYDFKREYLLDLLADHFEKYVDLSPLL